MKMYSVHPTIKQYKTNETFNYNLIEKQLQLLKKRDDEIKKIFINKKIQIEIEFIIGLLNKLNHENMKKTIKSLSIFMLKTKINIKKIITIIFQTLGNQTLFHDNFYFLIYSLFKRLSFENMYYFIHCIQIFYVNMELKYNVEKSKIYKKTYIDLCNKNKVKQNYITTYNFLCKLVNKNNQNNKLYISIQKFTIICFEKYIKRQILKDKLIYKYISCKI